ncbi:MAG: lysophospholipase, partial [Phycisphaerae bacterium]|nr:lysophospholipase [Phycisphaerae bacterium]
MTEQATEPIRHRCRPLHYDAGRDTLVHHEPALRAYFKPLPQPVYVIEPIDQPPRAVVVFIHGLCEHAYRFFPLARELSRRRIQTVLFHLHGHGAGDQDTPKLHWLGAAYLQAATSEQLLDRLGAAGEIDPAALERIKRENLGRMKTLKMEDHLQQVRQVADQLTRGTPGSAEPDGVPLLLGGHSLGGLLAAAGADRLARSGPVRPAGVFLLSPALRPRGRGLEQGLLEISWAARRHVLLRPV